MICKFEDFELFLITFRDFSLSDFRIASYIECLLFLDIRIGRRLRPQTPLFLLVFDGFSRSSNKTVRDTGTNGSTVSETIRTTNAAHDIRVADVCKTQ